MTEKKSELEIMASSGRSLRKRNLRKWSHGQTTIRGIELVYTRSTLTHKSNILTLCPALKLACRNPSNHMICRYYSVGNLLDTRLHVLENVPLASAWNVATQDYAKHMAMAHQKHWLDTPFIPDASQFRYLQKQMQHAGIQWTDLEDSLVHSVVN